MKIDFETDINGYQDARKFKMLLESYMHSGSTDPLVLSLIEPLQQQVDDFLNRTEFKQFHNANGSEPDISYNHPEQNSNLLTQFSAFLNSMTGPSRREMILSKQRQELIERAEHAEASAFEALAETAEIARERDEILQKMKQLEEEIIKYKQESSD
jgi:hypothetical protein